MSLNNATTFPEDFLCWVSVTQFVPKIGFYSSLIFGLILLLLNFLRAQKIFGTYKCVIRAFTTLGMVFATVEITVYPNVHNYNVAFLFLSGVPIVIFPNSAPVCINSYLCSSSITYSQLPMYINLAQFLIPKITSICSILINPFTVYIVWTDKKLQLGNYRYLLLYFAIFNMATSLMDMLVPMCVLIYRHAFSVFISDGFFSQHSEFNQILIAFRCSFISGAYAVLHAHFLYRYFVLFNNQFLTRYFMPCGLFTAVFYCILHLIYWTFFCYYYCGGDYSRRLYIRESMFEHHGQDVLNMSIIIVQYFEGTDDAMFKSRFGILFLSILSFISLALIFYFGYKIWYKLSKQSSDMSEKTKKLQTQLVKALIVQAAIPTCVSFAPCIISWYQPIFALDFGRWLQFAAGIAVSTFPALDPLALIYFVPILRNKFLSTIMFIKFNSKNVSRVSTTGQS